MNQATSEFFAQIQQVLDMSFLGNTMASYATSAGLLIVLFLVVLIFHKVIFKKFQRAAEKTASTLDDKIIKLMRKNLFPLLYFGTFYISTLNLEMADSIRKVIDILGIGLLVILLIRLIIMIIRHILNSRMEKMKNGEAKAASMRAIFPIISIAVWVIGAIFLLENMGFDITAVVTGLGIGGIAIALAAQSVLGDLFSYFCILFDHPFTLGDFIIVNEHMGVVEHIGIKTTRIRSLSGEILVLSNTMLTSAAIRNFKLMQERRVVFGFGVTYDTDNALLEQIPAIIRRTIDGMKNTRFDRAHFMNFGDFSLNFEVVYYVLTGDYNTYMDAQQEINLAVKRDLAAIGVEFAFPTHTLLIERDSSRRE